MKFMVKVQVDEKENSKVPWMKPETSYPVLDVYTYKEKADTKVGFRFVTWLCLGDKSDGQLSWVNAQVLLYVE